MKDTGYLVVKINTTNDRSDGLVAVPITITGDGSSAFGRKMIVAEPVGGHGRVEILGSRVHETLKSAKEAIATAESSAAD